MKKIVKYIIMTGLATIFNLSVYIQAWLRGFGVAMLFSIIGAVILVLTYELISEEERRGNYDGRTGTLQTSTFNIRP